MKNLFRFKLEVFGVVMNTIAVIISYSLNCDGGDWRTKAIMYMCGFFLLLSILGFNTIKAFRTEVLKRW